MDESSENAALQQRALIGRPTKYRPEMCARVVELMVDGAALCEVCAELGITPETMNQWRKHEDKAAFSEAVNEGIALAEAWWTRKGRLSLDAEKFQASTYIFTMKARFGWQDKQHVEMSGEVAVKSRDWGAKLQAAQAAALEAATGGTDGE